MLSDPSSDVSDTTALQELPRRLVRALPSLACPDCGGSVEHRGEFYDFDPVQLAPVPKNHPQVLIGGGRSEHSVGCRAWA